MVLRVSVTMLMTIGLITAAPAFATSPAVEGADGDATLSTAADTPAVSAAAAATLGAAQSTADPDEPWGADPDPAREEAYRAITESLLAAGSRSPGREAPEPYVPQTACHPFEKPGVQEFREMVLAVFPRTEPERRYYNVITECNVPGTSEHREGRAYDFKADIHDPVQRAQAEALLQWLTQDDGAQAKRWGVMYLIWDQHVWNTRSLTWHPMADRGNDTTNHRDHIHVSFSWNGALRNSSYWTGRTPAPNYGWCRMYSDQFAVAGGSDAAPDRRRPCPGAPGPVPQTWREQSGLPVLHGDTGARVDALDRHLAAAGLPGDSGGYFGTDLYLRVRAYQESIDAPATGVWDVPTQYRSGLRFEPQPDLTLAR